MQTRVCAVYARSRLSLIPGSGPLVRAASKILIGHPRSRVGLDTEPMVPTAAGYFALTDRTGRPIRESTMVTHYV